jgi:hypothetical protein
MKFAVVGCFAALVVYGVREYIATTYVNTMTTVAKGGAANCLEVLGTTTAQEEGRTSIIGNIRNNCGRPVGQVTVSFKFDPPSRAIAYAYVHNLRAGETRRFKSAFPVPNNTTYRFEGINAF